MPPRRAPALSCGVGAVAASRHRQA